MLLVGRFILVIVFIQSTNICSHFYFILFANANFSHSLVLVDDNIIVVLILIVDLFQISQLFMDILLNVLRQVQTSTQVCCK